VLFIFFENFLLENLLLFFFFFPERGKKL